jgi:hypothetical protein
MEFTFPALRVAENWRQRGGASLTEGVFRTLAKFSAQEFTFFNWDTVKKSFSV